MRPALVIFDCDGVLVDTEPTSNRVLAEAITAAGLPMTAQETAAAFAGETLRHIARTVEERLGHPLPATWIDEFRAARAEVFRTGVEPMPGAAAAVDALQAAGVATCVASQADLAKTRLTLGLSGLLQRFADDALFSAHMVERPKPAPDVFLLAATAMGHPADRCVVVEDTVLGVTAGVAAGMRVLAYDPHGDGATLAAVGGEPIVHLAEVPERVLG